MIKLQKITDQSIWAQKLQLFKNNQQLAKYETVSAALDLYKNEKVSAEAVLFDNGHCKIFYPYIKRVCPYVDHYYDITSAYEFSGFWFDVCDQKLKRDAFIEFQKKFWEFAQEEKIIAEFVRLTPFFDTTNLAWPGYDIQSVGNHVVIDLRQGIDSVWDNFHGSRRTQLRLSKNKNLACRFTSDLDEFIAAYHRNLDKKNAHPFYYFQKTYLNKIENKKVINVYDEDGKICASQVFFIDEENVYYFLSADVSEKRHLYPTNFGIFELCKWACRSGKKFIHLGGGHSSLFTFKSKFSSSFKEAFVLKRVHNKKIYERVCSIHIELCDHDVNDGYFPKYRSDTRNSGSINNSTRHSATNIFDE